MLNSCNNGGEEQLRRDVLKSIEEKIQSEGGGIEVVSFTLTHLNGNEYVGVLQTMENGTAYTYPVNVVFDGKTFVWEIPPTGSEEVVDENVDTSNEYKDYNTESNSIEQHDEIQDMSDAIEESLDPTYCSLCKGTGVEKNTAKEILGGPDGRICPMCEGKGSRTF